MQETDAAKFNNPVNRYPFRVTTPRRDGKRRDTLLYKRYRDMRSRCMGRATKCPWIYEGLELGWKTFAAFRAYALANGFTKETNSPDREDPNKGYVPGNVVFKTPGQNFAGSRGSAYYSDDAVRGREPPIDDDVPF
jgi:hypothetical protein